MEDSTSLLPGVPGAVPGGVPGGVFYPGKVHKTSTHPGKVRDQIIRAAPRGNADRKDMGVPPAADP